MALQPLLTLVLAGTLASHAFASEGPRYLQLIDRLDRPRDGYCFDVQGVVGHFRADKPLVAHNCKPGAAPDGLIEQTAEGLLYLPAFDQCVTAMGTGTTVLRGTSLMIKPCVESGIFGSTASQKRFEFTANRKLQLIGTDYCVVVGEESAITLSPVDRWRPLYMDYCSATPGSRSQWQFVTP